VAASGAGGAVWRWCVLAKSQKLEEKLDPLADDKVQAAKAAQIPPDQKAEIIGYRARHGRSYSLVLCACGFKNHFYAWSWAGHGKAKCAGCGCWIKYRDLQVVASERRNRSGAKDSQPGL